MKGKDRIVQLEAELAEVRAELDLIEQAETMERELAELKRRIAVKRPPFFTPVYSGHACTWCGVWVHPNSTHTCQRCGPPQWWQQPIISTSGTTGQMSSGPHTQAYNSTSGVSHIFSKRDDGPPDMGVLARVS